MKMNKAARQAIYAATETRGAWDADFRWSQMRSAEFERRFKRGGFVWWARVRYEVHLKPKRGQKR